MSSLLELRSEGRFGEAIDELLRLCRRKKSAAELKTLILREMLCSERCLVLDWAADEISNGRRDQCGDRLNKLQSTIAPLMDGCDDLFTARIALIRAVTTGGKEETAGLRDAIQATISAVEQRWAYKRHTDVQAAEEDSVKPTPGDPLNGPSFLNHLPSDDQRILFHNLAADHGWMHPGLLLAGETLAALEGNYKRADHKTSTWIMFAGSENFADGKKSHGILARLTLERLCKDGRGLLVPDPFASGYLRMDESFSTGLQHAWLAARIADKQARNYDWRWRIEIEEATRETPFASLVSPGMTGHSAEGALTCGLLAVGRGDELDRNTCMSAALGLPLQSTLKLDVVDGLDAKTLSERLRVKKIRDIVVCDNQKDIDLDTGSHHKLIPVENIASARTQFEIWPKITRAVREGLHREATRLRQELCGPESPKEQRAQDGRAYVPSPIGLRKSVENRGRDVPLSELVPLTPSDIKAFAYGEWKPEHHIPGTPLRLRLFADSGMGKTVQLVICEQKIAGDKTLRIPIRLGRRASIRKTGPEQSLEGVGWQGVQKQDLEQLATLHLKPHIPQEHHSRSGEWIIRMAELGQLVFLLDALDQTRRDLELMATFLKTVPDCPVLVAGRPESLRSRFEVFENQDWVTLELMKLEEPQQRRFLGSGLAGDLIPEDKDIDFRTSPEERRKHQWKDLLGIPLLLSLMKQLAVRDASGRNQLDDIRNRYSLYQKTSERLFQKGLRSIPESQRDEIREQAERLMKAIAGHMVSSHNFNVAEGDEFDRLRESIGLSKHVLQDLVQLDIIKEYAFLERIELEDRLDDTIPMRRGIEWRHRSFLEYFGALWLADQWKKDPQKTRETLRVVHESLDADGNFRLWPMKNSRDGSVVHEFRNLPADWHWTLRFLLAHLAEPDRSELARELVALCSPWIVFEAIDQDGIEFEPDVAMTCRWLVHRNWFWERDFRGSLTFESPTDSQTITTVQAANSFQSLQTKRPQIVDDLLDPALRDAGLLSSLRDVLGKSTRSSKTTASSKLPGVAVNSLAARNWRTVTVAREKALKEFLQPHRWVGRIPGHPGIQMSDFPVTNAVFEAFCASHRRFRDQYSSEDDQPAAYVSWSMAQEFCAWLTEVSPDKHRYSLPHEEIWYAACQWDRPQEWDYWWEGEMDGSLCWYGKFDGKGSAKTEQRTRSRKEAIAAFNGARRKHPSWKSPQQPGLLDMLGNVWEWCENPWDAKADPNDPGSSRVLRGGSWSNDADDCRSASRYYDTPDVRSLTGFRLVCE